MATPTDHDLISWLLGGLMTILSGAFLAEILDRRKDRKETAKDHEKRLQELEKDTISRKEFNDNMDKLYDRLGQTLDRVNAVHVEVARGKNHDE